MENATTLRKKTKDKLLEELLALRKEKFSLLMQKGSGAEVKFHRFKEIKKTIARIKTILNETKG